MKKPFRLRSFVTSLVLASWTSVGSAQLFYGDTVSIGDGWMRSYVQSQAGDPVRLGVQFDQAAFDTLTSSSHRITAPPLPAMAPAPYNHLDVNWNPEGHPGQGYNVPHFDFHFYFVTPEEVAGITAGPAPAPIPSLHVAPGYVPEPEVVPQMGWHFLDSRAPEFSDPTAFTQTLIYGYHEGKMSFIEPMITVETFEAGGSQVLPVRQPSYFQETGFYPDEYGYSVSDGVYDIFIGGLEYRAFTPVPEPATWGFAATALIATLVFVRKRRSAKARS